MAKKTAMVLRGGDKNVTSKHHLLTSAWTLDVQTIETAIGLFTANRPLANECQVALFELPGDRDLHVNVTHHHQTAGVRGWAGPAHMPGGFVHNRRFSNTPSNTMIRQIRDMVFAVRH
jgi:hypothetical protein